ncbi:unnamed protein product [Spirodela intermedia]|uniref:Uncharacterized protein n=1 Tax=Spirodela intermedia TaxID=51605 RepID=A0A7I8L622_SPIIN|nr:unnamed protein product [Spirodela intermedia]
MAAAADVGAGGTTVEDLHGDVLTRILRRLDGPSLAAAGCATARLRELADQPDLWEELCKSTWPSLRHRRLRPMLAVAPRTFFSDAYTFPGGRGDAGEGPAVGEPPPPRLLSAVDLFHRGKLVFSTLVETDTRSSWFLGSPFRVEALAGGGAGPVSVGDLRLSWIIIDDIRRRAVNLSSRRPVAVQRRWYAGTTHVRFATVLGRGNAAAAAVVACEQAAMAPLEVSLCVEDADGVCLSGKESLTMLRGVLAGERKHGGGAAEEEARAAYAGFVARRRAGKEQTATRERRRDLCCVVFGFFLLVFLAALVLR